MKKRLLILPLLGGLVLAGCTWEDLMFWKKKGGSSIPEYIKTEFEGYKLAKSVKDGGEYILGVYRTQEGKMRFVNGDYHSDSKGSYPYYMATTDNTTTGAAKVKVKMLDKKNFTLQVIAPGHDWDTKYIGMYPGTGKGGGGTNAVMSLAPLDSPDQASYTEPTDSSKTYTDLVAKFQYFENYANEVCYAPAALYKDTRVGDEEAVPKFMGTGHNPDTSQDDYTSVDAKTYHVALDSGAYDLAHLYEKK